MLFKIAFAIVILFEIVHCQRMKHLEDNPKLDNDIYEEDQGDFYNKPFGALQSTQEDSQFSIIAPGLLKSNRKYSLLASLHEARKTCSFRISITGQQYNASEVVVLKAFQSKIVDFFPPKINYYQTSLIAEGIDGCSFRDEKQLLVDTDTGPKIYIQTDKAVYKPQDLVQFRILFLDEHTKPLRIPEPVLVEILDAQQNIIKTFKDILFNKGLYTNRFQLSERPVMGTWTIRVSVTGSYSYTSTKTIQIKKYVLPKFSVHIKTPKHIVTTDPYIKAIIYGKYTFGKYVQGVATVQLWNENNSEMLHEQNIDLVTLAGVEIPLDKLQLINIDNNLNMKVSITETLTNFTRSDTLTIRYHNQRFDIIADYEDFEFRGFEPYRIKVRVQHWNGVGMVDTQTALTLKHDKKTYEAYMNDEGVATFDFENKHDDGYMIRYKESSKYIPNVYHSVRVDHSNTFYCRLKLLEPKLSLGSPVKIEVSSSEIIPHLIYVIVGHGNIVRMEHIKLPANTKSHTIYIKPSIEMIPISYIYVHYSHNGILRHGEMELSFPNQFENQISLTAPQEVEPGQEITLMLKAQPRSIVGLLAVDLGVHLMDPSYDLNLNQIFNELLEDRSYISSDISSHGEFLISGLVVLTNIERKVENLKSKKTIRQSNEGTPDYRTQFPEVWFFENVDINSTNTHLSFKVPDSITTWRITAFSINEKSGLGIVNGPTDIISIKPFFISLNLPYSVKWGEIVAIPILIFNYHSQALDSTIIMYNNDHEFEFMDPLQGGTKITKEQERKTITSVLPENNGKMFTFYIKPLKVGNINLKISASNNLYSDAVHQQLKVESEGIEKKVNQPLYIKSDQTGLDNSTSLSIDMPPNAEANSRRISLAVGGDYIVPTLDNLQKLVELPTGCGEQNMVHFAPNILVLQYLKAIGDYGKEKKLVATIKSYIDIGYQQQLSYRHANGGYSVFGEETDEEASTWLTAYTVRFFIKASKIASIEKRIIEMGLEYLSKAQLADGSFPYTGYLFNPAQKNSYGLTAFILATFLEDRTYASKYQPVIEKGLQFLTSHLNDITDIYSLSIVAFVLQMSKNSKANQILHNLQPFRQEKNGLVWWSEENNSNENNVEITAYILMALLDINKADDHLPTLKWLIKQRNDKGGFLSTQDTVVGLQALVKFSQKVTDEKDVNLDIIYMAKDQQGAVLKRGTFKVEPQNYLETQKQELPKSTHNVRIETSGTGSALLQLSHHYKVTDATELPESQSSTVPLLRRKNIASNTKNDIISYLIEPKVNILRKNDMDLEVCYTYKVNSNMVIMEVELPSGYRTDDEALEDLKTNAFIQRVEAKHDFTQIIFYLDKTRTNAKNCINISAYKTSEIFQHKSVPIVMYDYYNKQYYNSIFYNL